MELNNRPYTRIADEDSESVEEVEGTHSEFENKWKTVVVFLSLFTGFIVLTSQLARVEADIDRDSIRLYQTSQKGLIFQEATLAFEKKPHDAHDYDSGEQYGAPSLMNVDSSRKYQDIIGFGGAFTEAAAVNYFKLPLHWRMQVLGAYFGEEGAKFNVGRISINSCDFSTSSYSFDDVPGDVTLRHFDRHVQRDKQNIIPFIQQAKRTARADIALLASPWSPPAWMKVPVDGANGGPPVQSMLGSATPNGLIDTEEVKYAWAQYISNFISAYKLHGLHVWAVTPQNEPEFAAPWEACAYNSSFERHFIEGYLGPVLRRDHVLSDGGHIKILAYDHNKEHLEAWTTEMYGGDHNHTGSYVDGMAFHWYSSVEAAPVRMTDGAFGYDAVSGAHHIMASSSPGAEHILLPTEGCSCSGVRLGDWVRAERLGHDILYDLANHAQGYVMWNLLVDAQGGPNHLHNYCDAPIVVVPEDSDSGSASGHVAYKAEVQPSFHYMKHFSHFLPSGSRRIHSSIVGNYHYELNMDPIASVGLEVGFFPCERSVRQFWTLRSETGMLEMSVPSLLDPTIVAPSDGSTPCEYDSSGHAVDYNSSTCQKQHLCVFGSGADPNDRSARNFLKLGDCYFPPKDAPSFQFDSSSGQARDAHSGMCLESVANRQESGFLLRLAACDQKSNRQTFIYNEGTGELTQSFGSDLGPMCLTGGWPFLSSVAFLDTRAEKQTVVIVINEANYPLKLKVFGNSSSYSGDNSETFTKTKKSEGHSGKRKHPGKVFEVPVEPRSISTAVYLHL